MVFEACRRHSEGPRAEEDIGSRLTELHDRVIRLGQAWAASGAVSSIADADLPFDGEALIGTRRPGPGRTANIAAITPGLRAAREGVS